MKVTLFTGIRGSLAPSMQVYRDAVLNRLTVEHPDIEVREQSIGGWSLPVGSRMVVREKAILFKIKEYLKK